MHQLTGGARQGPLVAVACASLVLAAFSAAPASAAPCGRADLVDMTPPDGATDVPLNAALSAHYTVSADYLGEDVTLDGPDGTQSLTAMFDATEARLSVTPPELLRAGVSYTVHWPSLRGLNAAAPGQGGQASFTVAPVLDSAPPTFDGLVGASWDLQRETNDCTNDIEERFLFGFDLGDAGDDGGRDNLTLLLYQTTGAAADGGPVPVLAVAMPAPGIRPQVALPVGDAVGHICFAGLVRDTTGAVSSSADQVACVDTTQPPFFAGCGVAPGGAPARAIPSAVLALLIAGRPRRGRRRS